MLLLFAGLLLLFAVASRQRSTVQTVTYPDGSVETWSVDAQGRRHGRYELNTASGFRTVKIFEHGAVTMSEQYDETGRLVYRFVENPKTLELECMNYGTGP